MRYLRLFLAHLQDAFMERSRAFVWFLIALINPLQLLLFWRGAVSQSGSIAGWNFSSFATYYFLIIIASAFLNVHIDEVVAYYDIQQGYLANYLLRPLSYMWFKFFQELPWRIIQGAFGIIVYLLFRYAFGVRFTSVATPEGIFACIVLILFAYIISFLFKMLVGLSALWTTDYSGFSQLVGIIMLIFGGVIVPLDLYPERVASFSFALPFAYIFYFPVLAVSGKLSISQMTATILFQGLWVVGLSGVYIAMWKNGIKKFTAVGL